MDRVKRSDFFMVGTFSQIADLHGDVKNYETLPFANLEWRRVELHYNKTSEENLIET